MRLVKTTQYEQTLETSTHKVVTQHRIIPIKYVNSNIDWEKVYEEIRKKEEALAQTGRQCWKVLFQQVHTLQQLQEWVTTIPKYCGCRAFYTEWVANHPVYADMQEVSNNWKAELKQAVNAHLGKPYFSIESTINFWLQYEL